MDVARILDPGSVRCEPQARSKKHALELVSEALADSAAELEAEDILDKLANRERLGSTGLGRSVAMPHARIPGLSRSIGAFLRLDEPVDFDAADGNPVDLIFGLLVPEDCDDARLAEIGELIEKLGDRELQQRLREANEPIALYNLLAESLTIIHRALRS